jgi:membrane-bound lytic murein transglycosylase D
MNRVVIVLAIAAALAVGCTKARKEAVSDATQVEPRGKNSASGAAESLPLSPETLTRYRTGIDSVEALYEFGDVADFATARDSLTLQLNSIAKKYPSIREEPEFRMVLESLADLDSALTARSSVHIYSHETDSLALSVQSWPEIDSTQSILKTVVSEDTVFPIIKNDRIDFWIRYFTGPGKERFARTLYRMELYRPLVDRILTELDLPRELIAVAMIESGFNLKARSRARAVGPWQFIAGTARIYGLRVNWWYDERRDIVASTYAAGNYLTDLYGIWNDWPLALAGYNCGEYRVARAVARQKTEDFWQLKLPKQTQRYVPKFLAALYILRQPEKYGFTIPDVEPVKFDEVVIKDATDLKLIAKSAGTSVDVLRELNPGLLQWATPPKMEINVKVPEGSADICRQELASIPLDKRVTWRKHRIRKGETLSVIARANGTTITALKRLNGIKNAHKIRAGKYLIVPIQGADAQVASSKPTYKTKRRNINKEALEKHAKKAVAPANYKKAVYRVKSGDTLGGIAELFHTRASKIRLWNNLRYRSYIYPGQKLAIYVPQSFDLAKVPVEKATPSQKDYVKKQYVIKKGDTFYAISKRFNVKMSDLLAWNKKSSRSKIYPGQKIEIWQKK